jgi:hypothetical protein
MARGLLSTLVACAVALGASPALAQGKGAKKKVEIVTEPEGATVYLNLKEDGALCTTPCNVNVPVGSHTLIIELENYTALLENIDVGKKDKKPKFSYKLEAASGMILVKGPRGAEITIDEKPRGTAPARIEIEPGTHKLVLTIDDKEVHSETVELENGGEVTVEGKRFVEPADTTDTDPSDPLDPVVDKPEEPSTPRAGPILSVSALLTVGFRNFKFENPTGDLKPETEAGQVLVGPYVEIYPGTLAGVKALRGLALIVHYGHGANSQPVLDENNMDTGLSTYWRTFQVGARHRWYLGDMASVEIGAGYVRDIHRFNATDSTELDQVPDADYSSVRIGGRASVILAKLEPFVAAENRIVVAGKGFGDRFSNPSATGLKLGGGVLLHAGKLFFTVEASYTRYSWTFGVGQTMGFSASGASDAFTNFGGSVGYEL